MIDKFVQRKLIFLIVFFLIFWKMGDMFKIEESFLKKSSR